MNAHYITMLATIRRTVRLFGLGTLYKDNFYSNCTIFTGQI